ncbi:MAG: hypothetical protein AAF310_01110, partial [Myxococcota bacterium]
DIPDEQLNDGSATGILLMLLKHRRGKLILPILEKMWDNFKHLKKTPQGQEFVETALTYALLAGRKDEKHGIMKEIGRHLGDQEEGSAMTVASALKQEGRLEGRQEGERLGMQKGLETAAMGMLKEGLALEQIRKITHLSKQRITQLLTKLEHKIVGVR